MKTSSLLCVFLAASSLAHAALEANAPIPQDQLDFFEKKIRPVLAEKCYQCHSEKAEKIKGGLLLDTREGTRRGGDNGPAVVPGEPKESLLIEAIRYENKDFAMPPKKEGPKLPEEVIKDFEKWVQMGAPDPRDGVAKVVAKDDARARAWWSFQPPKNSAPPAVKTTAWPRTDIDRFLLAGLEAKGLQPVADADKHTLLRRVYFDLIGLPPTFAEIETFVTDPSPDALAKVVDRLLASPQFGERWGRHWLDVARYAESSGKESNIAYPHAWRYRDYVIAAFNADKPYDEFIREQIAGDLLPANNEQERAEHLVATGYLALGAKSQNEQNARQFAVDLADEQIDALSQGILGMTIACARCHDHKFDPISQREYYAMAGIFLSTETRYGTGAALQNRRPTPLLELPPASGLPTVAGTLSSAERASKEKRLADLKKERDGLFADRMANRRAGRPENDNAQRNLRGLVLIGQVGALELELNSYDDSGRSKVLAMGVQDRPATAATGGFGGGFREAMRRGLFGGGSVFTTITDSPLFARGEVDKPGQKVPRGFVAALHPEAPPEIPANTSGRRELGAWLASPQNPLTARVMTNRVWHWLFGRGLVESVDNFGTTGQAPSHPALLDHLALRFQENGWSVKKLVREIVLSRAYQLSSAVDAKNFAADPENTLVWRMSKRRLDAEAIRDAMLAVSGDLQLAAPVASVLARAGDGPVGAPRGGGLTEAEINAETPTRSVYLPIVRDLLPESLALFDFAEPSLVTGMRETTNVPSQALFLLNSPFAARRAGRFAERIIAGYPTGANGGFSAQLSERIIYAYWLAYSRPPTETERAAAMSFFSKFPANYRPGEGDATAVKNADTAKAAWQSFCRALFASAEFRYLN